MALDSYTYELCLHQRTETLRHPFMRCRFVKNCWSVVGALIPTWLRADRATTYLRRVINKPFAIEIIIIMCWSISKERNDWLFSNEDLSVDGCLSCFKADFALVNLREKGQRKSLIFLARFNFLPFFWFIHVYVNLCTSPFFSFKYIQ
jgi:hypothetical protein